MPSPFAPLRLAPPDGSRTSLLPYGAHVVSWLPPSDSLDRLFVSTLAEYHPGSAIRGGIPVIFPQFSDLVPGPDPSIRHGFARTLPWQLVSSTPSTAALELTSDDATLARWPHPFRARLTVDASGPTLALTLAVENPSSTPFAFTGALHTYLRVGDAAAARILGLATTPARDQAARGSPLPPLGTPLGFGAEVDHLYPSAPGPVTLDDPSLGRATLVEQTGWRDVVVWNPGPARGAALADLEPDGWRHFVCVEAVAAEPVVVAPGARWSGTQRLTAVPRPGVPPVPR